MSATPMIFCTVLGVLLLASTTQSKEKAPGRPVETLTIMDVLDNVKKIEIGDVITVRILEDRREALQQNVAVTGEIQAPYLGLLKADGLTCRELAHQIKTDLEKSFFKVATVIVGYIDTKLIAKPMIIPDCGGLKFAVAFGAIAKQGKYDLVSNPDLTVAGLLKLAGGHTSKHSVPKIQIVRKTPMSNKRILVNTKAILIEKNKGYDLFLRPDDVVIVE